jgi:lon-related putative ATP-dependent protease
MTVYNYKMIKIRPLLPKLLCTHCDPKQLNFKTTQQLPELNFPAGQERAMAAIELGIHIQQNGYNLYLLGPGGTGKHELILNVLHDAAKWQPTPNDWCYVNNFANPQQPLAIALAPGMGAVLRQDMAALIDSLQTTHTESVVVMAVRLIRDLQLKYRSTPEVMQYLTAVLADITEHAVDFAPQQPLDLLKFQRYQVKVLTEHLPDAGAPVIYERHPTLANLIGSVEYLPQQGAMIAHFNFIQPGALHRANGGYLILDAQQITSQRQAWDSLKRALYAQSVTIENSEHASAGPHPVSLKPAAIPLKVKVILLGERSLYYSLCDQDQNFPDLFKIAADFSNHLPRTPANIYLFARLLATMIQKQNLLPLNRQAVAQMVDYSSRMANDSQRLYINQRAIGDVLREASYWAEQDQRHLVKAVDIRQAIEQQIYRANRIESRIREDFRRNILLIETKGKKIGQLNGLSVLQIGHYSFGTPSRITVTVRLGKGEVIDIEREVELGGSLHSKGVFILSGFINGRYLVDHHLSISASLVFEQNYGEVEGDSASAAELAALLSAIAHIPVAQSLAITGSVNQYGQIQAIGNLNEKIEGFFSICQMKGLTQHQGVIIPATNVQHLMLKDEVVMAARKKNFFIYAVDTIDQVMSILTGLPAGKANRKGRFPENTVNGLVEKSLLKYAEHAEGDHKNDDSTGSQD